MRTRLRRVRGALFMIGVALLELGGAGPIWSAAAPAPAAARPFPLEVGTARGAAGEKVRGALKVGEASDGTAVVQPIVVISGRKPGPVVWIHAGTHGDEYGGVRALQEVVRDLDPARMTGTVVAVMVANPPAFQGLTRMNPNLDDQTDLSNTFPGNPGGFQTERIAAALTEQVRLHADYFVDLHTGGDRFRQHPFVLYSHAGGVPVERLDDLARAFGIDLLWRDTAMVFPADAIVVFSAAGIPSFLIEVGGGQPLQADDIRTQARAVASFLRKTGVLPGEPARLRAWAVVDGYRIVTNSRGGFFDPAVRPGDRVEEGAVLGVIRDAYGDVVETLRAPARCDIVIGVNTYPAWATGGWLIELGTGLTEPSTR